MEMGEAEQKRGQDQRAAAPQASFEQALDNAAKEQFIGNHDEQKGHQQGAQHFSPVGQDIVKVNETGELAEEKRERKIKPPLANSHPQGGSAGTERVARVHLPDHQKAVQGYIGKEQLGEKRLPGIAPRALQ